MNGIDALQRIRRLGNVPVLMLTAKGDDIDRISGLNLGADDYVAKPCSPGELVARIRAILRRAGGRLDEQDILRVGDLILNSAGRAAQWQGKPLELTGAEYNILDVLARNAGQLVPKQEISRRAFGRPLTPFDRRIDVHISSVRQSSVFVLTAPRGSARSVGKDTSWCRHSDAEALLENFRDCLADDGGVACAIVRHQFPFRRITPPRGTSRSKNRPGT